MGSLFPLLEKHMKRATSGSPGKPAEGKVESYLMSCGSWDLRELIDVDSEVVFELASYILQEAKGDFSSNEVVRSDLKKLPALPTQALKEHPSLAYCEDRVIEYYKKLNGQTRGQAIVNYMSIVESLPTYGVHYYAVKDKQGIPWWLGLSYKGIFQYDYHDKVKPRKTKILTSTVCQTLPGRGWSPQLLSGVHLVFLTLCYACRKHYEAIHMGLEIGTVPHGHLCFLHSDLGKVGQVERVGCVVLDTENHRVPKYRG
ncbi:hypothetical protein U0070_020557 [Myodes glareolus]|uniref:FERM domain-containing protein n=1 Tax=Myodes glareolus TaxID=447135 RepID=A0AAW0JC95_MYOGA